jgi:glycogen operon protein
LHADGVNFAVFAEHATSVHVCLFDDPNADAESARVMLHECTDGVWHGFVPGLKAGQLYGFRAHGPWAPAKGHRFNASKLLLDPYSRAIAGELHWSPKLFGYPVGGGEDADLESDGTDSAPGMLRSVVVDPAFDWGGDRPPSTPLDATVIYEIHVKGFTKLCPHLPEELRGTYAGLASDVAISYLKELGITAVELLPIQHFVHDDFLRQRGLVNFWGYNTIGYFAPHAGYSSNGALGGQVIEFKRMVKALHAAGIEVILDVVYNHTAEGSYLGPTLCFRGLENVSFYHHVADAPRYTVDFTGCGNSVNAAHPRTLQLIADSLRYWVEEMHVDGFRFDLASTLARNKSGFDREAGFFDVLLQDPVLARVKLIAEPWDSGDYGYQVGGFPCGWSEWNGRYRDAIRRWWKGDEGIIGEFAARIAGSADLYHHSGRRPTASVNFVCVHDGFTLADLVSYNDKHNEDNGEDNRDGEHDNRSWNCGAEGPTDDEAVNTLRRRQRRNFLATLFLSQGVPLLCGGDETGRSQRGNNNAYCQDNELSWLPWTRDDSSETLREYTRKLISLRREHPVLRWPKFFTGRKLRGQSFRDLTWVNPDGVELHASDWDEPAARCLGMILHGETTDVHDAAGKPIHDDTFMLLFNAHHEPAKYTLAGGAGEPWRMILDTQHEAGFLARPSSHAPGEVIELISRSMCVLMLPRKRPRARNRTAAPGA